MAPLGTRHVLGGDRLRTRSRCVACDPSVARSVIGEAPSREVGIGRGPGSLPWRESNAVDRAWRQAKLAAGATLDKHGVHQPGGADDRIDRTGGHAQGAANAGVLVDPRHRHRPRLTARPIQRQRGSLEQDG